MVLSLASCRSSLALLKEKTVSPLLTNAKRWRSFPAGPSLRSSDAGLRVTIFGAYGFIGRYVTQLIAGDGARCVIPFRGDDMEWRDLRVMGDLGMIVPMPFSPLDDASIRATIRNSDVVINLAGKDYETTHYAPNLKNFTFYDVNVTFAEKIAKICAEESVANLIHVSALGASKHAISAWSKSKAEGELAVRAAAPGATIIRPADVFGAEDRFLNLFARLYQILPRVPLVDGGFARVQPLYVEDLARAIYVIAMSDDPSVSFGQTYDLAGPEDYTYREIVEYVFENIRAVEPQVVNVSPAVADVIGKFIGIFPRPILNEDRFRRMQADVVLDPSSKAKRLHDLKLEATSMETPGFTFLHRYRSGSHFLDVQEKKTA